jgi:hypothetical protein
VSAFETDVAASRLWWARTRTAATAAAERIESWPVPAVLGALIGIECLAVLGLALDVRHNGWVYYQGGDQLWYYTLGWLLGHGHLWQTPIGYVWSFWLAPIARFAGPNVASAFPAVILLNVLVLLPVTMLALYGIARRIAGRLFGYWTLAVWIAVPFIGVLYTNTGYHQRYTEVVLPQGFGLTAMADFPAMVALTVALYFCARTVLEARESLVDAAASGVAAGIAIGMKPSISLVLLGPALAFVVRRQLPALGCFVAGLAPAVIALAWWKERGLGQLPLLSGAPASSPNGVAAIQPVVALNFHKYFGDISWHHFTANLDQLREYFWSGRLLEWLVVAGLIALGRRSRVALALVGASFLPFVLVKSSYIAMIQDTSLFRILIPAFPLFVLGLAALPFLVPGTVRPGPFAQTARRLSPRTRLALVGVAVLLTAVVPMAATAAASRQGPPTAAILTGTQMPVPVDVDLGLKAVVRHGRVLLTWRAQHPAGGRVFYRVWRDRATPARGLSCPAVPGAQSCTLAFTEIGVTRQAARTDTPGAGAWTYRVGVATNWLDDPGYGDVYLASEPLVVRVP